MLHFHNSSRAGLLPQFFSEFDPRPAREQLHEAYFHGGGVRPFERFELILDRTDPQKSLISYPGDPAFPVISWATLRDELILLFAYSWVVIVQPDDTYLVTRCD